MKLHVDFDWSKRQLDRLDDSECAAGIPLERLAQIEILPPAEKTSGDHSKMAPLLGTFGKLIRMLRRRDNLSMEALAARAEVELAELVKIENDGAYKPRPRTVHQLAKCFEVPSDELAKLAGLKIAEDPVFEDATLRFAAHSEELIKLTKAERAALSEYLKFLTQKRT